MFLGDYDKAVEIFTKARTANPRTATTYFQLAAALAMKGDLDGGKAALDEGRKLAPKINTIEFFRQGPCSANPECSEASEKTIFAGLRKLGFPDK